MELQHPVIEEQFDLWKGRCDLPRNPSLGLLIVPILTNRSWRSHNCERYEDEMALVLSSTSSKERQSPVSEEPKSKKPGHTSYPTNNFLGISKCIHMSILRSEMTPQAFNQDPLLQQLQKKSWLGRVDFVRLYSAQHLFPIFDRIFATNRLYSELYRSRAKPATKRICFKKLFLFARAYRTKSFDRIN